MARIAYLLGSASRLSGGMITAVRPLARTHHDLFSHDIGVFAATDEYSEADRGSWAPSAVSISPKVWPRSLFRAPAMHARLAEFRPEIVHNHGIWLHASYVGLRYAQRTGVPMVVSPHGMLDSWARLRSQWKKRLVSALYENRHLAKTALLHALCENEQQAIRSAGVNVPVACIPNGIDLPTGEDLNVLSRPDYYPRDRRTLLFLGRVHPKKGLSELISGWKRSMVRGGARAHDWQLVIAGWDEIGHKAELESQIEELQLQQSIRIVPPVFGAEKVAALSGCDGMVLTSYSEGLPMSILEAWAYKKPVLMSEACNIPEGFAAGAALCANPQPESVAQALERYFEMAEAERQGMGACGRALVESRFTWPIVAAQHNACYAWLLGGGLRPECVSD